MQFNHFQTLYEVAKKAEWIPRKTDARHFYNSLLEAGHGQIAPENLAQIAIEKGWVLDDRPYYQVFPAIIPVLLKLDLNKVPSMQVVPPINYLNVRLPVQGNPLSFPTETYSYETNSYIAEMNEKLRLAGLPPHVSCVKSFLLTEARYYDNGKYEMPTGIFGSNDYTKYEGDGSHGLVCLWIDVGEFKERNVGEVFPKPLPTVARKKAPVPIYTFLTFRRKEGESVIESIANSNIQPNSNYGIKVPKEIIENVAKLGCMICMLDRGTTSGGDSGESGKDKMRLIFPDLLQQDKDRIDRNLEGMEISEEQLNRYHERARQRGKNGWNVGEEFQERVEKERLSTGKSNSLYYVNTHPCTFWVGQGRTTMKIKLRTGHFRGLEEMKKVPTGYDGPVDHGPVDQGPANQPEKEQADG